MIKKTLAVLIIILLSIPLTSADFAHIAVTTDVVGKVVRPGDTAEFTIYHEKGYGKPDDGWMAGFYAEDRRINSISNFSSAPDDSQTVRDST
jgi:uncharacterized membrane protein